jgi:hypothetical protein
MKKLLFIALVGLTAISCKKDKCEDQNATNYDQEGACEYATSYSIEGMWTSSNQESSVTMSVSIGGQPFPIFNNMQDSDTSYTEVVDPADFEPTAIDIQSGGTLISYSGADTDTGSWTKNGSVFTANFMDTTLAFNIATLNANSLSLVNSMDTTISDMGIDISVQADLIMDFTR